MVEFLIGHFGYISLTFLAGVIAGWLSYSVFKNVVKPAYNYLFNRR